MMVSSRETGRKPHALCVSMFASLVDIQRAGADPRTTVTARTRQVRLGSNRLFFLNYI